MLVSNATAGILIGKGGMALKDSVFCLAVFLFKVDLNNRSTTPSLYASARKMGTRMVHWSEVICWQLTGDKILQGFIVKNGASFRAVFAGENAGAWRSYGMPSEAVSGAPFLPWQQLRSMRMNSGVMLVNWNSFIAKVLTMMILSDWWDSFDKQEMGNLGKHFRFTRLQSKISHGFHTAIRPPYHQGGHRVVCVAGKEVGSWSWFSRKAVLKQQENHQNTIDANWSSLEKKALCWECFRGHVFFLRAFCFFRDCSWRDSAFGEKTLAEKMLRIQIGQEAVDSVLATATGRGNCRVCGCQEDGPCKHRLVIIKNQRFIFTAVPSCGRKTVAISLFWSTWKKYRIS